MNIELEVRICLQEKIRVMGASNVTWQMITQNIDSDFSDIDDQAFEKVVIEAKRQVEEAKSAWVNLNCASN